MSVGIRTKFDGKNESATSSNTRKDFVEAFWQLYEKKDIHKIKVYEICELAGYHRNSFYRYFSDVYEVLDYIHETIINEIIAVHDENFTQGNDEIYIKRFKEIWDDNSRYLKVFADSKKNSFFYIKLTERLVEFLQKDFFFCENEEENEYIARCQIYGAIYAMMNYYTQKNKEMQLEELIRLLYNFKQGNIFQLRIKSKTNLQN